MSRVIGSLGMGATPFSLLIPLSTIESVQLSIRGLLRPFSLCKKTMMFKYIQTELGSKNRARYAAYVKNRSWNRGDIEHRVKAKIGVAVSTICFTSVSGEGTLAVILHICNQRSSKCTI